MLVNFPNFSKNVNNFHNPSLTPKKLCASPSWYLPCFLYWYFLQYLTISLTLSCFHVWSALLFAHSKFQMYMLHPVWRWYRSRAGGAHPWLWTLLRRSHSGGTSPLCIQGKMLDWRWTLCSVCRHLTPGQPPECSYQF